VKSLNGVLLLAGLVSLTAASLPAQPFISGASGGSFHGGGFRGGFGGYGGYGYNGIGWGYGFGSWGFGFGDGDLHHPEEHPGFGVGYGHGDPDFIQSTYMDYDKAVQLGNKLLAEQAKAQPSLGEIARQLRSRKRNYVPPPARGSSWVPPRSDSFVVIEGVHGKPDLCRSTDATCSST